MSDLVITKDNSTPTPPTGTASIYPKSDGKFYTKDESGTETPLKGDTGLTGATGPGVAAGGTAGQALKKNSGTDYDTTWSDLSKSDVGLSAVPNVDTTNPANIAQDATHRFASDTEKTTWNGKQDALGFTPVPTTRAINGHLLNADVTVTQSDVGLANVTNDVQLKAADLDIDGTLAANSDTKIPSQKAVKTYVDAHPGTPPGGTTGQLLAKNSNTDYDEHWIDPPNSAVWGGITGTLSNQTDLTTALAGKQASGSYEVTTNKATDLTSNDDTHYPTTKAVKTAISLGGKLIFGSRSAPRTISGTTIYWINGDMSDSAGQQDIYVVASASGITSIVAVSPGTVDGQEMTILGCDNAKIIRLATTTTNLNLNGDIELGVSNLIRLRWDGTYWQEMYRR